MTTSDVRDVRDVTAPAARPPGPLAARDAALARFRALEIETRAAEAMARLAYGRFVPALSNLQHVRGLYGSVMRFEDPPQPGTIEAAERCGIPVHPTDAELDAAVARLIVAHREAVAERQDAERQWRESAVRYEQARRELDAAEADLAAEMEAAGVSTARAGGRLLVRLPGRVSESALPEVEDA